MATARQHAAAGRNPHLPNCRFFRIAGITVRVESDLDLNSVGFRRELVSFAVEGPGDDNVTLRHHFELPDLRGRDLGTELYRRPPWVISRKDGTWFYRGVAAGGADEDLHRFAVFTADHALGTIYSTPYHRALVLREGFHSLSLLPTDQIWLVHLLADRDAALFHSSAAIMDGRGLMFIGHSGAGKSTTAEILRNRAEILCDDRNVVRRSDRRWRLHGTWSHGDVPDVSAASAPLRGVFFLRQDARNDIVPLTDRKAIWRRLLATLIRPMTTAQWWNKELDVIRRMVDEVPFFMMHFTKSGHILTELERVIEDAPEQPAPARDP